MNRKKLQEIYLRLKTVTVLSDFTVSDICVSLSDLLETVLFNEYYDGDDVSVLLEAYSDFARTVYEEGGDLGLIVKDFVSRGNYLYIEKYLEGAVSADMEKALIEDLATLQMVAGIKPGDIIEIFKSYFEDCPKLNLPGWDNSPVKLKSEFNSLIKTLGTKGYGIFKDSIILKVEDEFLIPVMNPDYQRIEDLHGYERERELVLKNTEAFAKGHSASNVLLYGDAGTGKSTTVKAAAAYFANKGIRLIEFNKRQVKLIPEIAEELVFSPLKFIFFIDDLTFKDNDDDYYALKGILEGDVNGKGRNILIYATSNRRHLLKESMLEREGDDVHLNDTLQETMSLSARFGLTITFSKPEKDLYLSIVENLAKEHGLISTKDKEYNSKKSDLFERAEAFAIRANGRSPRTAKQFIVLAMNDLR